MLTNLDVFRKKTNLPYSSTSCYFCIEHNSVFETFVAHHVLSANLALNTRLSRPSCLYLGLVLIMI